MPRRWGIDDDEVEPAVLVELVELLHRHVLLRARERAGDVAVEAVAQDAVRLRVVVRIGAHELVEGGLGVEHERVQATTGNRVAVGIPKLARDLVGRVREVLETQRVGQPLRRIDGHHHCAAAPPRALDGEGRGGRRLPDTSGAAADEDVVRGDELQR